MRGEHLGIRETAAGDRGFHNQFLLPNQTFRANEGLSACSDRGIRPGDLDGRLSALIDLILVVFIEPLRETESFLLYLDVFVQTDEVGIKARDTGYGIHNLLSKH